MNLLRRLDRGARASAAALVAFMLLGALARDAGAQTPAPGASPAAACPPGNLLANRRPWAWADTRGLITRPTDGVAAPEGAVWDAPPALVLDTGASTVTWDLGAATTLGFAWIQADANDEYTIFGSLDGRTFRHIGRIDPVDGHGLRGRRVDFHGAVARYVRFGEGHGDTFFSLSEFQLFCEKPAAFPPPGLRIENAPVVPTKKTIYDYWNDEASARWELVLALLGLALLSWGWWLARKGRPDHRKKLRDRLLAVLGVLAAATYINFGFFHFSGFIHDHEWTHYYIGAKYFPELGYERIYACLSVADSEEGTHLRRRVERRKMMNLRTNFLGSTEAVLRDPDGQCKQHFTQQRWQEFKHDVRFFRARQSARRWDDIQIDHGFNGSPVWLIAGRALSSLGPASTTQLYALSLLDPAYLLGMIGVVWWAFGWRVLAVALLVFSTNFPSRFYWTGGGFLRWDWLFYLVAALACLKKKRPVLAGAALAYSTGLRIFPLLVFIGPVLAAGLIYWRERRFDRPLMRFFAAAALAGALLFPVSLAVSGGMAGYRQFVQNTVKHKESPMTNLMGLRTVLAWRPSEVGRVTLDNRLEDPWDNWKRLRIRAWRQAWPVYAILLAGFLVLLGRAVRGQEPWVTAALSVVMIPVGVELLSYYYACIIGVALLHDKREAVGRWLLLLTAYTQFVAWAPQRNMSRWLDEQYTLMSAAMMVVFAIVLWTFSPRGAPQTKPASTQSPAPATPAR